MSLKYYAKVLSDSLWIKMLDQKWKDYLSQLESQKSLLDGALLFSQSLQGSYMCPPNVEPLLIVIIVRVKQLVAEMENNAFALKTTANNTKNAKKMLDLINQAIFDEMGFSCVKENGGWTLVNYQIEKVLADLSTTLPELSCQINVLSIFIGVGKKERSCNINKYCLPRSCKKDWSTM